MGGKKGKKRVEGRLEKKGLAELKSAGNVL